MDGIESKEHQGTIAGAVKGAVKGAAGGALATLGMSGLMLAAQRAGLMPEQPPKHIARAALPGHRHRPKPGEGVLGLVAHFGFGMGCGSLYGGLLRGRRAPAALGIGYALAIWVASYEGWVPAMNILPPISDDRSGRPAVMAAAHVVYGSILSATLNRLRDEGGTS